jgi:hypothetical protein
MIVKYEITIIFTITEASHISALPRDAGTGGGGAGGAAATVALYQGGGAKRPFQFKGLPAWRNSELSEMLVQFFYEFASENARNAVIELQE